MTMKYYNDPQKSNQTLRPDPFNPRLGRALVFRPRKYFLPTLVHLYIRVPKLNKFVNVQDYSGIYPAKQTSQKWLVFLP